MLINDPVGDFLARIRNAQMRQKDTVSVPATKLLVAIAEILQQEKFIESFELVDTKPQRTLEVVLRYVAGEPVIRGLKRVSRPGVRRYIGYREIPKVKNGQGVAILTTPKGVMTGQQAAKTAVGGELLCLVY